jgi:predicted DNA-binding transcriptional regulator YafY
MTGTPARLLSLLSLLQAPRERSGAELADRLQVTRRTIRRDVERLRELGYPVRATLGPIGGYRLAAGTAMPPLLLDHEEAVAIAVGLRTAARQAVEGIEEASVRALSKLLQVLPPMLRRRVGALGAATVPFAPWDGPSVDPEDLTLLAGSIAEHVRVRFRYRGAEGTETERLVEPHRLVATGRRWYLLAFDGNRGDWRIFRVDRISEPRTTGVRAAPRDPPAQDAAAYVTSRLYDLAPTYRAVVTLQAPTALVVARLGDAAGEVEAIDADTCRLHSPADTLEWLALRLATLGCEFEVHEPPELAAYLRDLGGRATRAAHPLRAGTGRRPPPAPGR